MSQHAGTHIVLAGLAALAAACSGPAPAPPPTALPPPMATTPQGMGPAVKKPPEPAKVTYENRGRRDPFETLGSREGTGTASVVASAKLTGIVRSSNGPMALVETPDGLGYILKRGDTLGDGRLVEINQTSVVFAIPPKPGTSVTDRVVLTLPTN